MSACPWAHPRVLVDLVFRQLLQVSIWYVHSCTSHPQISKTFHRHHVCICSVIRIVLPNKVYCNSWRVGVKLCVYVSSTIPLWGNPVGLADTCCEVHLDMCATCRCEHCCPAELGRHPVCASSATACEGPA